MLTFPEHITRLEVNIYVRFFKLIGGLCMFIIISGIGLQLNSIVFYINYIISLLFIFYKLIIIIYVIKQLYYKFFKCQFLYRNSPLDPISTILKGTIFTLKTATDITIGGGFTYALYHELEDLLVKEGKETYFFPSLKKVVSKSGLEEHMKIFLNKLGIKDRIESYDFKAVHSIINNLSGED